MKKKIWQVWIEKEGEEDTILFEGSETRARKYYREHGGASAGLHFGYDLGALE